MTGTHKFGIGQPENRVFDKMSRIFPSSDPTGPGLSRFGVGVRPGLGLGFGVGPELWLGIPDLLFPTGGVEELGMGTGMRGGLGSGSGD